MNSNWFSCGIDSGAVLSVRYGLKKAETEDLGFRFKTKTDGFGFRSVHRKPKILMHRQRYSGAGLSGHKKRGWNSRTENFGTGGKSGKLKIWNFTDNSPGREWIPQDSYFRRSDFQGSGTPEDISGQPYYEAWIKRDKIRIEESEASEYRLWDSINKLNNFLNIKKMY